MTMDGRRRITILGGGAMGTYVAYLTADAHDVTIVDPSPELVAHVDAHGIVLDDLPARKVHATCNPGRAFNAQLLFVFVRAGDTLAAMRPFGGNLNPATPVVSLQNGFGNEEAIKAALGPHVPLVLGITDRACRTEGLGRTRRFGGGTTILGAAGASPTTAMAVRALLDACGMPARIAVDIRPHLWGKLIANAAISSVAALLDAPNGIVVSDPDASALARAVVEEGAAVARAMRAGLPFADAWTYVRELAEAAPEARSTMTADLAGHHPTEIDRINGVIVAFGKRHDVPTPANETVLRLVRARERMAGRRPDRSERLVPS